MTRVRKLRVDDLPRCARLGLSFYDEAGLLGNFVPGVFCKNWSKYLSAGFGVLYGAFSDDKLVGVIGGVVAPDPNNDELVAQEMFWYVLPECRGVGLRLLVAYRRELEIRGVKRWSMIYLKASMPEKLRALYERLGLREQEVQYQGELS